MTQTQVLIVTQGHKHAGHTDKKAQSPTLSPTHTVAWCCQTQTHL